ncbi:MAG TPA: HAD family hydrolase [Noviherbaspirillum sp.]|uniref:HAD family hydrolase n=1 Tax=Noviherbaspirillum sp. TaxID=1926288 RepID=UPI002D6AE6B9|nr:HAD family hydrolase [Noviherbaspirillum sp.]HYD94096.1 HAD family hydrolase [Noviherbaspirillum sp.]
MAIEAITLALDGVIFDTEDAHLRACNAAFAACGLDLHWSLAQWRAAARVRGATNAVGAALEQLGVHAADPRAAVLAAERSRLFHAHLLAQPPLRSAGCAQLMADALESGCKLAVVTDMPVPGVTALLDHAFGAAVTNMFSVVVGGADFSTPSGNGPYSLALRTMGANAANCVAIDASVPGLRAAQQAGIWTMAVTSYEKDIARISGADIWCPQMLELCDLVERNGSARPRPQRFVTFDALSAFKSCRPPVPVLKTPSTVQLAG